MAGDAFQKLKDTTSRAITKISVKTSSSLEKSKLKLHIESLGKEVYRMSAAVGEELYSLWTQNIASTQSLEAKLEEIKQKKAEIAQLTQQLNSIDDRDNEIFGIKAETPAEVIVPATPSCPNCGAETAATAKFCRKCGFKLQ